MTLGRLFGEIMATLVIGTKGERLDLLIRQGADFGPYLAEMKNPDGTPVDLTGCVIRGSIRKTPASSAVAAAIEVAITDATAGQYQFGVGHVATSPLKCGVNEKAPESLYVWDLEMQDAMGRVMPLYYGDVGIFREITRA